MLEYTIHTKPMPQKQTRLGKNFRYDPSKNDKHLIMWNVQKDAPKSPLLGPIKLELTFYMPIPKSTSKTKKTQMLQEQILPTTRPDIDNLAYIVTNALKGIIYNDDAQIVDMILHKRYSEQPRTNIKVTEYGDSI